MTSLVTPKILTKILAKADLSGLPTSNPGNGRPWIDLSGLLRSGAGVNGTIPYIPSVSPSNGTAAAFDGLGGLKALGYTPANDSNVVHNIGNENIAGNKTFTGRVLIGATDDGSTKLQVAGSAIFSINVRANSFQSNLDATQALIPNGGYWYIDSNYGIIMRNALAGYATKFSVDGSGNAVFSGNIETSQAVRIASNGGTGIDFYNTSPSVGGTRFVSLSSFSLDTLYVLNGARNGYSNVVLNTVIPKSYIDWTYTSLSDTSTNYGLRWFISGSWENKLRLENSSGDLLYESNGSELVRFGRTGVLSANSMAVTGTNFSLGKISNTQPTVFQGLMYSSANSPAIRFDTYSGSGSQFPRLSIYGQQDATKLVVHGAAAQSTVPLMEWVENNNNSVLAVRGYNIGTPIFEVNPGKKLMQNVIARFNGYQSSAIDFAQTHSAGVDGSSLSSPTMRLIGNHQTGGTQYWPTGGFTFYPTYYGGGYLSFEIQGSEGIKVWRNENRAPIIGINSSMTDAQLNIEPNWSGKKGIQLKLAASQSVNALEIQKNDTTPIIQIDQNGSAWFGQSGYGGSYIDQQYGVHNTRMGVMASGTIRSEAWIYGFNAQRGPYSGYAFYDAGMGNKIMLGSADVDSIEVNDGNIGTYKNFKARAATFSGDITIADGQRFRSGSNSMRLGMYPEIVSADTLRIAGSYQSILFGGTGAYSQICSNVYWTFNTMSGTTPQGIVVGNLNQAYTSTNNPSARFIMPATGKRQSQVGDGLGNWQTGYTEEYNSGGGGIRCAFFGNTAVAKQTGDVATGLVALGLFSSATLPINSLTGLGTGVATALAINTGTTGSIVTIDGNVGQASYISLLTTEVVSTPSGTTQTIILANGNHQTVDLTSTTGDATVTITVPSSAGAGTIIIKQHASSARNITWASSATIKWAGSQPTWSSDATSSERIVSWRYNGSTLYLSATDTFT